MEVLLSHVSFEGRQGPYLCGIVPRGVKGVTGCRFNGVWGVGLEGSQFKGFVGSWVRDEGKAGSGFNFF